MTSAKSLVDDITGQLRDDILRGQYRPGERLPSERDLAARFEVNRGAVREAIKKLEQLGIASVQPGGARVVAIEDATLEVLGHMMDLQEVPNATLVAQMLEVAGAMMSMSGATAVARADDEQLALMREHVQTMSQETDPQKATQAWNELGDLFLRVNENLVLRLIANGLKTQFVDRLPRREVPLERDRSGDKELLLQMDNAIAARDAKAVRELIQQHFEQIRQALAAALKASLPDTAIKAGALS